MKELLITKNKKYIIILIVFILTLTISIPATIFAQNSDLEKGESDDRDNITAPNNNNDDLVDSGDTVEGRPDDNDEDSETTEPEDNSIAGYTKLTIDEYGKVILSEEIYKKEILETPGIPIFVYIKDENGKNIQVKAYEPNESFTLYQLAYIINLDMEGIIKKRATFKHEGYTRTVDYIEHYENGKLKRIEYFDDGLVYKIDRFDESGTYSEFLGSEEVEYIDPYGFYNSYVYNSDREISKYKVYYPNDKILLEEVYSETTAGKMIIVYDNDSRTRTVKILDKDGNILKEEYFNDNGKLIFYKELEYNGDELEKITIIEDIEKDNETFTQKVIFYYDGDDLSKRERYLDDELISETNYQEDIYDFPELETPADNEEDNIDIDDDE